VVTEKQAQRDYDSGKTTKAQLHASLSKVGTSRHAKEVSKKKNRQSMSSSKWKF
jgi:hypothetical protein